jgi:hypothetical protein
LLENFANSTAPTRPIEGQIWYDTVNQHLNFYNSVNWKSIATLEIGNTSTIPNLAPATGDLLYNSSSEQLSVYNGSKYILVGPPIGADTKAGWRGDYENNASTPVYGIKAVISDEVISVVSAQEFSLNSSANSTYPIYQDGAKLYRGINLIGADPTTGKSSNNGIYFWGSAAHAIRADTSTYTNGFATSIDQATNQYKPVTFLTTASTSLTDGTISINYGFAYNPLTNYVKATRFEGVATSALYADLAERYAADDVYEPGTVLVIGGEKEVTISTFAGDTAVAGIVSTKPALMMNSEAGNDETHPYIALKGRVPCKVWGYIRKGDLLMTSEYPGYACKSITVDDSPNAIIAKALEDQLEGFGVIEVMVV